MLRRTPAHHLAHLHPRVVPCSRPGRDHSPTWVILGVELRQAESSRQAEPYLPGHARRVS